MRGSLTLALYGAWVRALTARQRPNGGFPLAEGATLVIPLDGSATIAPWVAILRAFMMMGGVERALADAHLAVEQFAPASPWRPSALPIRVAHALLGATDLARADLAAAVDMGTYEDALYGPGAFLLALLAARQGAV